MRPAGASRAARRAGTVLGAGLLTAGLAWTGYAARTWARYGVRPPTHPANRLLDRFMPDYEVRERHEIRVDAPAEITWAAARELDLRQSPIVRAIFSGRSLLMGSRGAQRTPPGGFLAEVVGLGWRVLAEDPGRGIVLGAVTRPWEANVAFRGLPPETFAAFAEPGYAQIAWTFEVDPIGPERSVFRTETRVRTTDPAARARFRRYWAIFSPGIVLIRLESLRLIRRAARCHPGVRQLAD